MQPKYHAVSEKVDQMKNLEERYIQTVSDYRKFFWKEMSKVYDGKVKICRTKDRTRSLSVRENERK